MVIQQIFKNLNYSKRKQNLLHCEKKRKLKYANLKRRYNQLKSRGHLWKINCESSNLFT